MTINRTWSTLDRMANLLEKETNWKIESINTDSVTWRQHWEEVGAWDTLEQAKKMTDVDQQGMVLWESQQEVLEELYEDLLYGKLTDAIEIATKAHKGQVDKSGVDYINHPLTVMSFCETIEAKIVGILHDVLEDTSITNNELIQMGIPSDLVSCIEKLSHKSNISYMDYIRTLRGDSILEEVKLADLKHNMDISRIKNPSPKDYARLEKYKKAKQLLLN